jgi:molybdenum-dependent DNA-binding transcriptional regulator ModE
VILSKYQEAGGGKMDELAKTKSTLEALMREHEIAKARAAKAAAKAAKKHEPVETSAMDDLKSALWDHFMAPYEKYGL